MRNHVHDFFQSLRHFLFLFLEFVNEFVHVIEAAFAFGTVGGRLQDGGTLIVGENDVTGSATADGNLRSRGVPRRNNICVVVSDAVAQKNITPATPSIVL